ncbi:hypothetical protein GCM10026983_04100 [Gracilibacillus alcaliphilus]
MQAFLAKYQRNESTISIINEFGETIASRIVHLPLERLVASLTEEIVNLSHEHGLYHEDISAIGLAVNIENTPYSSKERLVKALEDSFRLKALVDADMSSTKESVLAYLQEEASR